MVVRRAKTSATALQFLVLNQCHLHALFLQKSKAHILFCWPWKPLLAFGMMFIIIISRNCIFCSSGPGSGSSPKCNSLFVSRFSDLIKIHVHVPPSPYSWQWGRRWWRCPCHVSPASSYLPPLGSPHSGRPPCWRWWPTSFPFPAHQRQASHTHQAWWSCPQREAWESLGGGKWMDTREVRQKVETASQMKALSFSWLGEEKGCAAD